MRLTKKLDGKVFRRIKSFDYRDKRGATSLANRLREHRTYTNVRVVLSPPESRYFGKVWVVWAR